MRIIDAFSSPWGVLELGEGCWFLTVMCVRAGVQPHCGHRALVSLLGFNDLHVRMQPTQIGTASAQVHPSTHSLTHSPVPGVGPD